MATYKVIQDIEAEDKLLGPLSLRQFIYACVTAVIGYLAFQIAMVNWLVALPLLAPVVFFGLLAAPIGKDQPTEVWLLAKIRFFLKPRRRIWDQAGAKELVTITAPKKTERPRTKGFSQTEVRSRLKALAATIDSRGWAVKNVDVNLFAQPAFAGPTAEPDRLVSLSSLPAAATSLGIPPVEDATDMLDEADNPTARELDRLIDSSTQAVKQRAVSKMTGADQPDAERPDFWFLRQNQAAAPNVVAPGQPPPAGDSPAPREEEQALLEKILTEQAKPKAAYARMKTINPDSGEAKPAPPAAQPKPNPSLGTLPFNDDLTVDTIARQANKNKASPDNEVVVSLR